MPSYTISPFLMGILGYNQSKKYVLFDWSMKTQYIAYLKATCFSRNLIGCQLKIAEIF